MKIVIRQPLGGTESHHFRVDIPPLQAGPHGSCPALGLAQGCGCLCPFQLTLFCALKPCQQEGLIQPESHRFMPAGCREMVCGSHCLTHELLNCPAVLGKILPTGESYLETLPLRDARTGVLLPHFAYSKQVADLRPSQTVVGQGTCDSVDVGLFEQHTLI
jgi:hypothetical protein